MKIIIPGHRYVVNNFEDKFGGQTIQFIQKEKSDDDKLVTISDGTTNEELMEVLIDRISYLNDKFPCKENAMAITKLQEGLMWLEKRTNDRIKRGVEGQHKA